MRPVSKDSMIFRPRGRAGIGTSNARSRIREDRRIDQAKRRHLDRLVQARRARMVARRSRLARSASTRFASARGGLGRVATRAVVSVPGIIALGVVVAGAVALRLATGRSFENMGAQLNRAILGDLDEKARAKMGARKQIEGNAELLRAAGKSDRVGAEARSIYSDLYELEYRKQLGRGKFMESREFQVNGLIDQLILRFRDIFTGMFSSGEAEAAMAKLERNYGKLTQAGAGGKSPR